MGNAMLLALVTGQRLGDISNIKFSDIWDDLLHVEQEKTGSRLAIPLDLKCDASVFLFARLFPNVGTL